MELALTAERVLDELAPEVVVFNEARYAATARSSRRRWRGPERRPVRAAATPTMPSSSSATRPGRAASILGRSATASWERSRRGRGRPAMEAELEEQFEVRYGAVDLLSRRCTSTRAAAARDELTTELGLDPAKPNAVLFSHILWDANLFYGDDLFEDQEEWLIETIRSAAANSARQLDRQAPPGQRLEAQARGTDGRAPRARGDPVEARRAAAARAAPAAGHGREHARRSSSSQTSRSRSAALWASRRRSSASPSSPAARATTRGAGSRSTRRRADEYRALLARLHEQPPLTAEQVVLAKKHAHALFSAGRSTSRASAA